MDNSNALETPYFSKIILGKDIGNSKLVFELSRRLSLVINPEKSSLVKELLLQKVPSSKVVDESGGSLMLSVPTDKIYDLQAFFK